MKRRNFLQAAVAGIASAAASSALGRDVSGPRKGTLTADAVVFGAGAFGAWTAYQLRKNGMSVVLADANGAGNAVGAAGGHTRTMRAQYGTRVAYTRLAMRAAELWNVYQKEWGEQMLLPSERVRIWPPSRLEEAKEEQKLLAAMGVEMRILSAAEGRKVVPQITIQDEEIVIHTSSLDGKHPASAAIMLAAKSGGIVAREFKKLGGTFVEASASAPSSAGRVKEIVLSTGQRVSAGQFVFACGHQLLELFPKLLDKRGEMQRRFEYYVETPQGNTDYSYPRLPLWGFNTPDWYGYPSVEGTGFKISHVYTDAHVDEALAFVKRRFPGLTPRLKSMRVCHDLYTPTTDFIIDRHPEQENVWIAGGGSGHGFKHGPALGEHIAAKLTGGKVDAELDALCRWKNV
jgi:sarcosine oxidase